VVPDARQSGVGFAFLERGASGMGGVEGGKRNTGHKGAKSQDRGGSAKETK